jgi:hypothetical protein
MTPRTKALSLIAALLILGAFAGQAQASQSTGAGAGKVTFNPF